MILLIKLIDVLKINKGIFIIINYKNIKLWYKIWENVLCRVMNFHSPHVYVHLKSVINIQDGYALNV